MVFKALKMLPNLFVQGAKKLIHTPAKVGHQMLQSLATLPRFVFGALRAAVRKVI